MTYLVLHFLNFLAVKHIEILIASNVVALHLIVILFCVMCLKTKIKMYMLKIKKRQKENNNIRC